MLMRRFFSLFVLLLTPMISFNIASANKIFYPHVAASDGWQTQLCAINDGDSRITVAFRGADSNGNIIETITKNINAYGRTEINISNAFSNPKSLSYVIAESDKGNIKGYTKFYIGSLYRGSVPAKSSATDSTIYVPHIASDNQWWTGIGILNTSDKPINPQIKFNNGTIHQLTLAPYQKSAFTISSLVGDDAATLLKTATIENAQEAVAFELFGTKGVYGYWYLSGVSLDGSLVKTLYFPHITTDKNSNGQWWTGIVAFNPGSAPANLTLTGYDESGNALQTIRTLIPANDKYVGTAKSLALNQSTAWLKLSSDQPITGFELFGTNDGKTLGGYECNNILLKSGILPKIDQAGWTGIAFVNPGAEPSTLTLKAISNAGATISTATYELAPGEKIVRMAQAFFPQSIANAHYLQFESSGEVLTFQLNGSADRTMVDAMAALPTSTGLSVDEGVEEAMGMFSSFMSLNPLLDELMALLQQIIGNEDPNAPVTITPPLDTLDLDNLPSSITAVMDCGQGYVTTGGETLSGKVTLEITNLSLQETGITLNVRLIAEDFRRNGELLFDGEGTFDVALQKNGEVFDAVISVAMDHLQTISGLFDGSMSITIPSLSLSTMTFEPMTVSFNAFNAAGHSINTGTISVSSGGEGIFLLDLDIDTDIGPANGVMQFTNNDDDSFTVNTPDTMTFGSYVVDINNVVSNPTICTNLPISGNIVMTGEGEARTLTFTGDCDAYTLD